MKKVLLITLLVLSMAGNAALASGIVSKYDTIPASRLSNTFPHTVSKDGSMIIEGKLTATDYASILMALTNVQNNSKSIKDRVSGTYYGYVLTSEFLFVKPTGDVISTYDHKEGNLVPNNKVDITSTAQFSMAFHDVLKNIHKFDASDAYQKANKEAALKHGKNTASYVFNHMYSQGKFFNDSSKASVDLKSMANGLLSFHVLWNLEKDPVKKDQLASAAKEIYDYMALSWYPENQIFSFNGDGSKTKFDLRDFGLFLWGTKELTDILAASGHGYEALNLMTYTHKMMEKTFVPGVTIRPEGIVREIEITGDTVSAVKDEINTGRLYTFLYAFMKWNESPFTKLIGIQNQGIELARDMILYSVHHHMDQYGLIHDTKFSDVSIKNDAKETPYLTWFMTATDYFIENHGSTLTATQLKEMEKSIDTNYQFLMNTILMSGKKLNELSGV